MTYDNAPHLISISPTFLVILLTIALIVITLIVWVTHRVSTKRINTSLDLAYKCLRVEVNSLSNHFPQVEEGIRRSLETFDYFLDKSQSYRIFSRYLDYLLINYTRSEGGS